MTMMASLSLEDLGRIMKPKLRLGETLIWVGQPEPIQFSREVRRAYLFQLGLLVVLLPVSVWVIADISRSENMIPAVLLIVGSMIGYFLLAAPWRYPNRVLQTIYAITDRRALVHRGFGWSLLWLQALPDLHDPLWSFDARKIRARRRIDRYQGRTDLVFGGEPRYHMTGRGQIGDWIQVGFLGLANVNEIERLLESQFANMDTEWA